ncbi:DinI-like family protein [Escherichia coli]|uniref:DinI-like family protein n=1 Tax=Escherichia coli TaxID=562 RepID=UPI001E41C66B|nr:DinI-like family protein [Escherichia coli]MCC8204973.1 DinI-like family protein [Escherichia coli]MCC8213910.1 DinI-like family protein [Escherichia coli]MCC8218768.1 DinI-like family protein [Escherichia coli]MCC8223555.1 DinI-like family protein [Escherichia coli]
MRIEICIAKEKMTKMPNGAVDALKEELTRRISKRYDDVEVIVKATSNDGLSVTRTADKDSAKTVEVIVKATSNDGLSVTRTADKDSAKTFVQETLKDTWESADEWFVH